MQNGTRVKGYSRITIPRIECINLNTGVLRSGIEARTKNNQQESTLSEHPGIALKQKHDPRVVPHPQRQSETYIILPIDLLFRWSGIIQLVVTAVGSSEASCW